MSTSNRVLYACYSGPWIELRWATKAPRGEKVKLEQDYEQHMPVFEMDRNGYTGQYRVDVRKGKRAVINTVVIIGGRSIGCVKRSQWPMAVPAPTRRKAVIGLTPGEAAQVKQLTWRGSR